MIAMVEESSWVFRCDTMFCSISISLPYTPSERCSGLIGALTSRAAEAAGDLFVVSWPTAATFERVGVKLADSPAGDDVVSALGATSVAVARCESITTDGLVSATVPDEPG